MASSVARSSRGRARRSCDDAVEHLIELEAELHLRLVAVLALALEVGVVAREQLLGQLEDALLVVAVDAEHRREHAQRVALRDLLDEVALALARRASRPALRALSLTISSSRAMLARREESARHLAEVAVIGRVHLDDREHLPHRARRAPGHLHLLLAAQDHRAFAVAEQVGLARDVDDVGVPGDAPRSPRSHRRTRSGGPATPCASSVHVSCGTPFVP